jgi:hypothetical protein
MENIYVQNMGVNIKDENLGLTNDTQIFEDYLLKNSFVLYKDSTKSDKIFLRTKDNSMSINMAELFYDTKGVQPNYLNVTIVTPDKKLLEDILNLTPRMKLGYITELNSVNK